VTDELDFDPFDLDELRANPPTLVSTESQLLGVSVRKPKKDEFVRVNSDPAYTVTASIIEHEGGDDRKADFYVPPRFRAVAEQVAGAGYRPVQVFTCITKHDVVFLWACRLPDERENAWHTSGLAAASEAMTTWTRVQANMKAGRYEIRKAKTDFGDPAWPDVPFGALMRLAFDAEHTITSEDHPVLQELRGEI
jgi:hypothetical protein